MKICLNIIYFVSYKHILCEETHDEDGSNNAGKSAVPTSSEANSGTIDTGAKPDEHGQVDVEVPATGGMKRKTHQTPDVMDMDTRYVS